MGFFKDMAGAGDLDDAMIAADFLLAAKTGMKNYAAALSETVSPEVHDVLKRHFDTAVNTHVAITNYMMRNGYYHAFDPEEQFIMDERAAERVLRLDI